MRTESQIVMIKTENLIHHPDNPRKDLGDLTELEESIKKNGLMQNLTVIPIGCDKENSEEQPDANDMALCSNFYVLIGNRRMEAAKHAGVEELPCKIISNISKKEQVGIMLEENMQRTDLTIYEQAQGFQMMLDLGETIDTITEKTGFSQSTVYHRLNIAKLDQDKLKQKEQSENFQMSLKDLYELEKIKEVDTRNKILSESNSSRDIIWKVNRELEAIKTKEKKEIIVKTFQKRGIEKLPKAEEKSYWNNYNNINNIYFKGNMPNVDEIELPEDKELYYFESYNSYTVITPKIISVASELKAEREKTEQQEKNKKRDSNLERLREIEQKINAEMELFVKALVKGKIEPLKDETQVIKDLWSIIMYDDGYRSVWEDISDFVDEMLEAEVKEANEITEEEVNKKINKMSMVTQMLLLSFVITENKYCYTYQCQYDKEEASQKLMFYFIIEEYGFSLENKEDIKVLNGSSPLYLKEEGGSQ